MKKVLVTGADGYCGWPVVLSLLNKGYNVVGVDNGYRRKWVSEVGADSIIPISNSKLRESTVNQFYNGKYVYKEVDITKYDDVVDIIEVFKPESIIHLASQPSAPYSAISVDHCNFTQQNNTQMLRNIIWALKNLELDDTHLIVTTTTGIYGAPDFEIPEGNIIINKDEIPFPSMSGSWYHMSRAHDSANMWFANKQYKFPMTELRTSIVCGSSTSETKKHENFTNRFDADFYFGVVTNRFISQALAGKDLTVYGKGLQRKPMISLEDMVRSTVNCFEKGAVGRIKKYEIYNQMELEISIVDIANTIQTYCENELGHKIKVKHIPNPRIENEEHQMIMHNERFLSDLCGGEIKCTVSKSIEQMCSDLYPYKNILESLER